MRVGTNYATLGLVLLVSTLAPPPGQPSDTPANDFQGAKESRVVTWQVKRVPPPSPLYVDVDDQLNVGVASSLSNELVTVNYRLLRASDGVIVRGQFTVAPPNTRAVKVGLLQLAEGFLLSVSCKAFAATTRGQTFARIFIGSGPYGAGQPSYMLMSDYVTTAMAPAFPNGRQLAPIDGPGLPVQYQIGTVLGQDVAIVVPTNARWRPVSLTGLFTASAQAATRSPQILLPPLDNVNLATILPVPVTVTASQKVRITWYAGGAAFNDAVVSGIDYAQPLPAPLFVSGNTLSTTQFGTVTANIQTGDLWTNVWLNVEEWLDNV